jgi:hypothetical protein
MDGWFDGCPPTSGFWFWRFEKREKPVVIRVTYDEKENPPGVIGEIVGGGRFDNKEDFDGGQYWGTKIILPPS